MDVRAINVGFDLRKNYIPIDLSYLQDDQLLVYYDGKNGQEAVVQGTKDHVAKTLAQNGYDVIVAFIERNRREIRCGSHNPDKFECQAPNDNYWLEFDSIDELLMAYEQLF